MPLLYQWAYLAWQVGILTHRVPRWISVSMTFSSSTAYVVHSGMMTFSQHWGSFPISSSLISLCHITKVYEVFNTRILPSTQWVAKNNGNLLFSLYSNCLYNNASATEMKENGFLGYHVEEECCPTIRINCIVLLHVVTQKSILKFFFKTQNSWMRWKKSNY